jgi:hypothetical protein
VKAIFGLVSLLCALQAAAQAYPETLKRLDAVAATPIGNAPDQFRGSVAASIEASRRIAAESGLRFA